MGLVLSSADQSRLVTTLNALLSPLASPTPEHWFARITEELKQLLHCDSSQVAMVLRGNAYNFSADSPALAASLAAATSFKRGEMHFDDSVMEQGLLHRRRRSMAVFTSSLIDHSVGGTRRRSAFYNEVCVPANALETYGLLTTGPEGEAMLGVNCGAHPHFDPIGGDTLSLLQVVLPAFQSGFETLVRVGNAFDVLAATLDCIDMGMIVVDASSGREIHRNAAAKSFFERAASRSSVEQQTGALVRALRRQTSTKLGTRAVGALRATTMTSGTEEYRLNGSVLPPGAFECAAGILITLEYSTPQLPAASTLRKEMGLTAREAEITLRLAEGLTDPEIARALGISTHTVRHHVERIFLKLGIRSRKALGLFLLKLSRRSPLRRE